MKSHPSPQTPLLVFDLDGTLVDTAPDLIGTLNQVLILQGLQPIEPASAASLIGRGARVLLERGFDQNGASVEADQIDRLFETFLSLYEARIAHSSLPYPGALSTLDMMAAKGWAFAVCTNKLERLSRLLLDQLAMSEYFRAICGADTFPVRKPDPRHLLSTIEAAGGSAANAVMVGDSRTDIETAQAAGVPIIAVDFGYTEAPVETYNPDVVISHFNQLPDAIEALSVRLLNR